MIHKNPEENPGLEHNFCQFLHVALRAQRLCSPAPSLLFSPSGYLPLFLDQVHPADLQQEVHVPLVGGCPGLAPGSVLHGLHSRLELLQAQHPQGLLQRGRELAGRGRSEVEESWGMVVDGCLPG